MKYRDYRKCGHGPLAAAVLSCNPLYFYVLFAFIGILVGVFSPNITLECRQ